MPRRVAQDSIGIPPAPLDWKRVRKSIVFAGATGNGIGDESGSGNPADIFTVTGSVKVRLYAICTNNLSFAANATIEVGISGNTGVLITTTD